MFSLSQRFAGCDCERSEHGSSGSTALRFSRGGRRAELPRGASDPTKTRGKPGKTGETSGEMVEKSGEICESFINLINLINLKWLMEKIIHHGSSVFKKKAPKCCKKMSCSEWKLPVESIWMVLYPCRGIYTVRFWSRVGIKKTLLIGKLRIY